MIVQGYAAPFNSEAIVENGVVEILVPGAFVLTGREVLLFGEHGGHEIASCADGSLTLFQDAYGLAFEANLESVSSFNAIAREGFGCSINMVRMRADETVSRLDGERRRQIHSAHLDHVAVLHRPAYGATGCWPADIDWREFPGHLRALAERWGVGRPAAREVSPSRQSYHRSPAAAVSRPSGCPTPTRRPPPIVRPPATRAQMLAAFRANPGRFKNQILGHAAFSRARCHRMTALGCR